MELIYHEPWTGEDGDHMTLELVDGSGDQVDAVDLADYPGAWDTEDPYCDAESDLLGRNGLTYGDVTITKWW